VKKRLRFYEAYREMMADDGRLNAYRRAIFEKVEKGDVVLDLGSGLGILAFFAAQAGAERVYAVEEGEVISLAEELASLNGYGRVIFIQGKSTEVELPEKVDLIITETFGSFGLDENTAEYLIDARKRFLKRGGELIPESLECFIAPAESRKALLKINFWKKLKEKYGVDHAPVVDRVFGSIIDEAVSRGELLAAEQCLYNLNFYEAEDSIINSTLEFEFEREGCLHGFAGWFKAGLSENVFLTTAPGQPATHWKQAFFPVKYPVRVGRGDGVVLNFTLGPKAGGQTGDTMMNYTYACYPSSPGSPMLKSLEPGDACPCGSRRRVKECCPELLTVFQSPASGG
jgi:protein arginine N-methyltransferase 1